MPNRLPWTQRTFSFDHRVELFPELIERLRGTPARVRELVASIPREVLTLRDRTTWSVQENIGHLADAEPIFAGRLDDYDARRPVLRAASTISRATYAAEHNERRIEHIVRDFRALRTALVVRLESLRPSDFARSARHTRLDVSMRLVDLLLFHAEHDDYHLARMRELGRVLGGRVG